jgi:hypothetical protein
MPERSMAAITDKSAVGKKYSSDDGTHLSEWRKGRRIELLVFGIALHPQVLQASDQRHYVFVDPATVFSAKHLLPK